MRSLATTRSVSSPSSDRPTSFRPTRRWPLPDVTGLDPKQRHIALARAAQSGNDLAAARLIDEVDSLIWQTARRWTFALAESGGVTPELLEDVCAQARFVLYERAIPEFDPALAGWTTHAAIWIRHACARYLQDHGRTVRIPVHLYDVRSRVPKAARKLAAELGRNPTDEEIANHLDIMPRRIALMREVFSTHVLSLDAPIGDAGSASFLDFETDTQPLADDILQHAIESAAVRRAVARLPERLRLVVQCRMADMTLDETSDQLAKKYGRKLTVERVRQLELKAHEKLRSALRSAGVVSETDLARRS